MTDEKKKDVGKRLRQFRTSLKLTQEKMSEKLNISGKTLGSIERGEKSISVDTIIALQDNFNCDINFLLCGQCADSYNPMKQLQQKLGIKKALKLDELIALISSIVD